MAKKKALSSRDPMVVLTRLLDKTTRVMQKMSMRLDVMAFGQRQLQRRIHRLERSSKRR
jgi:hypothetical protein